MKIRVAILGSTGSIGKSLLEIIKKNKNNFEIVLLSANKNYKELIKQSKTFNVKNIIVSDYKNYKKIKNMKLNMKIYNDFNNLNKIFKSKIDYLMSAITGIQGLKPTFKAIKHTKKIAIANKESIICAWHILNNELKRYKTKFIPVDSEHFSIWSTLNNKSYQDIDEIFITASGGPFYRLPLSKFPKIKIKDAIKHPNWKMGKKISVDSSTMMNKVFEVIEAKNIFDLQIKSLKILIHPSSYVHAIVKFKNGLSQMVIHDTDMKIPIHNTVYDHKKFSNKLNKIDINKLNNLELKIPDVKKFPFLKVLKKIPKKHSLFETVIVSTNDALVELFLKNKIKFNSMPKVFFSIINLKKFKKYQSIRPKTIDDVIKLNNLVQIEINSIYI